MYISLNYETWGAQISRLATNELTLESEAPIILYS